MAWCHFCNEGATVLEETEDYTLYRCEQCETDWKVPTRVPADEIEFERHAMLDDLQQDKSQFDDVVGEVGFEPTQA